MSHESGSLKSIFYALAANFSIAVAKFWAALVTNSSSMMAESIHSLADCSNQILLLWGLKRAKKPPSPDHPLGYGKSIYFWSFIVALMLFSMGGIFSIYEGIHKLHATEPMKNAWVAVGVLLFGIVAEGLSLYGCILEVNKERQGRSFWCWFRETRKSELLVIFGEDLAALLGLSFALIAVSLTMLTGNPIFDALGSIVIGLLLIVVAVLLGIEIKALIVGQGVETSRKLEMITFIENCDSFDKVFNLLTLQLGSDVMVAVKARPVEGMSASELIQAINQCEAAFKSRFPDVLWLFFEPDFKD